MKVTETPLEGMLLIEPDVYHDERGRFHEVWNRSRYPDFPAFDQDNLSRSRRGVLRGLHYQHPNAQGKLVSCPSGEVFDVGVDLRRGSPTFGQWWGTTLSGENHRQLWIPPGFAHGFAALADDSLLLYKCAGLYSPGDDRTLLWDDPDIGVDWPITDPILSEKDRVGRPLKDLGEDALPAYP